MFDRFSFQKDITPNCQVAFLQIKTPRAFMIAGFFYFLNMFDLPILDGVNANAETGTLPSSNRTLSRIPNMRFPLRFMNTIPPPYFLYVMGAASE
jgi:hypothetical protein